MKSDQTIKILIFDDDIQTKHLLRLYLEREGWDIDDTGDGKKGLEFALDNEYQLIILGWTMPGVNGIEICKKIRERKSTPVIMLTLKGDEFSKLRGFQVGVDDYIIKPFSPREVVYRVKALLRRSSAFINIPMCTVPSNVTILSSEVTIDHDAIRVLVGKEEVKLRRKEYELLYYLARTPNRVFSREELLKNVWNYDIGIDNRTVDTHIRRLRKKLAKASLQASKMIVTHWGIGYTLEISG